MNEDRRINFHQTRFQKSAARLDQCPKDVGGEVAFAGRSNAGKSSALNALTQQTKLARTSKTPGRTQLINFFSLNEDESLRIVDLPGYGYAKVAKSTKQEWDQHLEEYLQKRQSLKGLVLLMDIRHPMKEFDVDLLNWAIESELPCHILLTKADKLKRGAVQNTVLKLKRDLAAHMNLVTVQPFSALKKHGLDVLSRQISEWLLSTQDDATETSEP